MKQFFLCKAALIIFSLCIFNIIQAQQTTFRIQYDVAIFDLPGGIIQNPSNNFVFSGTNATLGTTGHVFEINQNGNVIWSRGYSAGGLSTQFSDIKNVSGGGYIVTGSTGSGCLLAKLDGSGNVTWANRYRVSSSTGSNEFGNKVIQTSDGGFVVAGSVTRVDPDGAGSIARQDSSKMFCMKVNSAGTLQWMRTFFYTTAFDDDDFLYDVAEVSDGYVFVGSTTIVGADGQSDAVILKTDINGNLSWFKRWGNTNSEEAYTILNNGTNEVVISGDDNGRPFVLRVNTSNSNPTVTGTNSIYTATGGLGLSAGGSSLIKTIDNQFAIVGTRVGTTFTPPFLEFSNFLLKVNASTGAVLFGRNYNSGFISILPVGLQARDTGYVMNSISATIPPGVAAYDYGVVKTDKSGQQNVNSNCPEGNASFNRGNYAPSFTDIVPTTVTTSSSNSVTLAVATITPVQNVVCRTIACIAPPQPTVTATQNNFCPGTQTTINASGGSNVTYRVYIQATGGTSVGTTPYNVSPTATTTYYVEADDNNNPGCVSTRTAITITVLPAAPLQPGVISGATNPCPGTQNYTIANVTNATSYNWSVSGGGTISGSGTSININWTNSGTYTISVTATNSCGTSAPRTLVVNVQNGAPTTISAVSGNTSPCPGQQIYSINTVNNATDYQWTVSGGGVITSPQGTNYITLDWQTTGGPYTVSVVASNACGSVTASTNVTVLNGVPATPASINGNASACTGNNNFSIQQVANATGYTWSVSNGGIVAGGQNTTIAAITFPNAGTYTVSVTANNSCGNSSPQTLVVEVISSLPTNLGTVTGNNAVCFGTETYTVGAANNATSYTWTLSGNAGTIISGQGTTSIDVSWAAIAGNYTVSVVAVNACGNSAAATLNVNVAATIPNTPIAVSGNNNPCPGIAVYTIQNVNNATTYTWSISAGGNIVNGQGTNSVSVEWLNPGGPYTISVTANNACGSSSAATYTVDVQQGVLLQPGEIFGDTLVCPGNAAYNINAVNGAVDYTWSVSSGGTITSGQGTNSINVNWNQSGGLYTISVSANSNCASSVPSTINVVVNPGVPATPANITGNVSICSGNETYQISNVLNATNYNWTLSGGGTIISGQGTTSVTINWNGAAGSYQLSVNAENDCGVSINSNLEITILPAAPLTPNNVTGNINVCPDNETYSVTNIQNATSYIWSVSNGGTIISGQGTNTINVIWTDAGSYTLSVSASNSCGTSTPQTLNVTVNLSPTLPNVIVNNDEICEGTNAVITASGSSGGSITYNFYDVANGGNVVGNSPFTVSPNVTTTYYLEVVNEFGCRNSNVRIPVTISVLEAPETPEITAGSAACVGESTTLQATVVPSNSTVTWWDASTNGNLLATGNTFTTPAISAPATFYVIATNANGCSSVSGREEVLVNVIEKPVIVLSTDKENNAIFPDEAITITASPSGYDNYEFFINSESVQSSVSNTYSSSKFNNSDTVKVIATENGCSSLAQEIIIKQRDFPNAFTPNGDGKNDVFLKGYDLVVLNRWGQELYEGKDGWDGTFDGKKVSPGTYFYVLTLQDITDRDNVIKGTVLVIED